MNKRITTVLAIMITAFSLASLPTIASAKEKDGLFKSPQHDGDRNRDNNRREHRGDRGRNGHGDGYSKRYEKRESHERNRYNRGHGNRKYYGEYNKHGYGHAKYYYRPYYGHRSYYSGFGGAHVQPHLGLSINLH